MSILSKFTSLMLGATLLLSGCKGKDGEPGPAGPAGPVGPSLSGSLIGFITAFSEDGDNLSKAGITVTITSVTPQISQTTDANGRFEFPNLKTGTYNLAFSRTGLGTNRVFGFAHLGGDQPTVMPMYLTYVTAVSQTMVSGLSASGPQFSSSIGYYTNLSASLNNNSVRVPYRAIVLYASASSNVSASTGALLGSYYAYQNSGSPSSFEVLRSRFVSAGFATGSTVYLIAYGVPEYYNLSYVDPATGRTVYPGMNPTPSQVVTTVVP